MEIYKHVFNWTKISINKYNITLYTNNIFRINIYNLILDGNVTEIDKCFMYYEHLLSDISEYDPDFIQFLNCDVILPLVIVYSFDCSSLKSELNILKKPLNKNIT